MVPRGLEHIDVNPKNDSNTVDSLDFHLFCNSTPVTPIEVCHDLPSQSTPHEVRQAQLVNDRSPREMSKPPTPYIQNNHHQTMLHYTTPPSIINRTSRTITYNQKNSSWLAEKVFQALPLSF